MGMLELVEFIELSFNEKGIVSVILTVYGLMLKNNLTKKESGRTYNERGSFKSV